MSEAHTPHDIFAAFKLEGIGQISVTVESGEVVLHAKQGIFKTTKRFTPDGAHDLAHHAYNFARALLDASSKARGPDPDQPADSPV